MWRRVDLSSWIAIAALGASGAVTPGPSLAVVLKNTVSGGRSRGIATGIGHGVGVGIYAFGAVAGFSAIVAATAELAEQLEEDFGIRLVLVGFRRHWRTAASRSKPGAPASWVMNCGYAQST